MILDNPFKLLGLPATASSRVVRRRFDELSVKASLGDRSVALAPDDLSRVRQAIEDPVQRLRHEVFWFHSDPAVYANGGEQVVAELREAAGRPPGPEQAIALHDLAVLTFARYLGGGEGDVASALKLWAEVASSEEFWSYLAQRASEAGDARLTSAVVEEIRRDLPGAVLEPVAGRAAALIDDGDLDGAAELIRAMRRAGLDTEATANAARAALAPIRAKLEAGTKAVDEAIGSIPSSEGATAAVRKRLEEAEMLLIRRVLSLVARLRQVDPVFNDEVLADRAAAAVRRLSVAVCNHLNDWTWGYVLIRLALETAATPKYVSQLADDQAQVRANYHRAGVSEAAETRGTLETNRALAAIAHIELAVPYARDEAERADWMRLLRGAGRDGFRDEAVEAKKREIVASLEHRADALRAAVTAAMTASDAVDDSTTPAKPIWRPASPPETPPATAKPRRWGRWLAGAAAALVLVGIGLSQVGTEQSASSSEPESATASPDLPAVATEPELAPEPEPILDDRCDDLFALEQELDDLDEQIADKRALQQRLKIELAPLIDELEQIDRDYPSNELPPDIWDRYVVVRDDYDALAAKAKNAVRDGNALIREYNEKVGPYNELRKEC